MNMLVAGGNGTTAVGSGVGSSVGSGTGVGSGAGIGSGAGVGSGATDAEPTPEVDTTGMGRASVVGTGVGGMIPGPASGLGSVIVVVGAEVGQGT